jgi:hypothetical protein
LRKMVPVDKLVFLKKKIHSVRTYDSFGTALLQQTQLRFT